MTIYSLDVLLVLFGTSLLFHVQFQLFLPELHTGFSRGRSGGLVFPSLEEFSTVYCDRHWPQTQHKEQRHQEDILEEGAPETICKDDISSQNECNSNEVIKVKSRDLFFNFIKMTLFPSMMGSLLRRVDTGVGLFQKNKGQRESQAKVPT